MNGKMGHHNKAFPAYRLPTRCRLVPSSLVAHHVCLLVHLTQMVGIARTVIKACEFASCEGGGKAPQLLFDRKEEQATTIGSQRDLSVLLNLVEPRRQGGVQVPLELRGDDPFLFPIARIKC